MIIVLNNIKRILRNKFSIMTMIVLPVIFICFSMYAFGSGNPARVAVIDNDNTVLTQYIKDSLAKNCTIVTVPENELREKLIKGRLDYGIKLDKGFTQGIIDGKNVKVKTYSIQETNTSMPVKIFLQSTIGSAKNIAKAAMGSSESFYKGMEYYSEKGYTAEYSFIEGTTNKKSNTAQALGFIIMFMLYLSNNAASMILEDKQLKTYSRLLSSPLTMRSYMLQNILSFLVVMLMQLIAIFAIMKLVFRADFGPSILNMFVLFAVFAIVSVSLGVAISSFCKDRRQSNSLSQLIIVPMCMLGGCFWPKDIMPSLLQQIAKFIPTTWALEGVEKLLFSSSLSEAYLPILILLLFALVFFLIGINKGGRSIKQ